MCFQNINGVVKVVAIVAEKAPIANSVMESGRDRVPVNSLAPLNSFLASVNCFMVFFSLSTTRERRAS